MKNAPPLNKISIIYKIISNTKLPPPLTDQSNTQLWSWGVESSGTVNGLFLDKVTDYQEGHATDSIRKQKWKKGGLGQSQEGLNSTLWPRGSAMHHLKLFLSVLLGSAKDGSLIIVTIFTMNQSHTYTDLCQVLQKAAPVNEGRPLSPASCQLEHDTCEAGMLPPPTRTSSELPITFSTLSLGVN